MTLIAIGWASKAAAQSANFYRLLQLKLFEDDLHLIAAAADLAIERLGQVDPAGRTSKYCKIKIKMPSNNNYT